MPVHDDRRLFEMLILEGAQAGLSWITILRKRPAYRRAFDRFDPKKSRDIRRAKAAGAPRRRRHRPQPAQDRRGDRQRARVPRGAGGVRQLRRVHLAVRRRTAEGQPPAHWPGRPGANRRIGRAQPGPEDARLQVRRLDDLLRVHAGRRSGGRSRDDLFPQTRPQGTNRSGRLYGVLAGQPPNPDRHEHPAAESAT